MNKNLLKRLGLKIGHYTDKENLTGTTAFISESGADIGIDIRGSNTGTLNTPAFDTKAAAKATHAVVMTGGSTFGLESAFGVMQFLEEKNIGNKTRAGIIPGITGAVIYDIAVGNKVYPTKQNGYTSASNATQEMLEQGNIGVGTGATVGKWFKGKKMKGGFGIGVTELAHDMLVAAFVVTNAVGDVVNPITGEFYSETGKQSEVNEQLGSKFDHLTGLLDLTPSNTTLAVIATNVAMNKYQLMKVAELAHDGMARAIHPIHTNMDGDVIFTLSSRDGERKEIPGMLENSLVDVIGLAAADALVKAINSSVIRAKGIKGFPSYQEKTEM